VHPLEQIEAGLQCPDPRPQTATAPPRRHGAAALTWITSSSLHASLDFALVGAVVGEFIGSTQGLGYLVAAAKGHSTRMASLRLWASFES